MSFQLPKLPSFGKGAAAPAKAAKPAAKKAAAKAPARAPKVGGDAAVRKHSDGVGGP